MKMDVRSDVFFHIYNLNLQSLKLKLLFCGDRNEHNTISESQGPQGTAQNK